MNSRQGAVSHLAIDSQPLVSVLMLAYNHERLVASAIESVIAQSYKNWELVIGDDCSGDGTYEIIKNYQIRYPEKIKIFKNSKNIGITKSCNKALGMCLGKYIAFLGGDDVFLSNKLMAQVALMEENPNCVLSYHDIEVFSDSDGKILRRWNSGPDGEKAIVGSASKVAKALVLHGTAFIAALSVMARKDAIPSTGFDERVLVASDWLMWINIVASAAHGSMVSFTPDILARYRRHSSNITNDTGRYISDPLVTLSIVEADYPSLARFADCFRGKIRYSSGVYHIIKNDRVLGRELLLSSIKFGIPSIKIVYWILVSFFPGVRFVCERFRRWVTVRN